MRVLVTGASGLLGSHLLVGSSRRPSGPDGRAWDPGAPAGSEGAEEPVRLQAGAEVGEEEPAAGRRHEVVGIDRNSWWADEPQDVRVGDLGDDAFVDGVLEDFAPEVVFHCAALTSVDACEEDPERALEVNGELTGSLARRSTAVGALFVYISTDGVFRGDRPDKTEDDEPDPPTVYGRSKLRGEVLTAAAGGRWVTARTNLYGWSSGRKTSSAEWMYRALESGEPVTLFDDFWFNPIYCVDLVDRLWTLVEGGHEGLFHVAGRDRVTKWDFGMGLAGAAGLSAENARPGSVHDAGLAATRPPDMSLSSDKYRRATGRDLPTMTEGVARFVRDRNRPISERFDPSQTP